MGRWAEITKSEEYQSLSPESQAALKQAFFQKRILPQLEKDPSLTGIKDAAFQAWMNRPDDSGQGYATSLLSSAGRGATAFIPGAIGGVGELTGIEPLVEAADATEGFINKTLPVNPIYRDDWGIKGANALGQVGSTLGLGGVGGLAGRAMAGARGIRAGAETAALGSGFLSGAREGGQAADRYGMEGVPAYVRKLLGGATEVATEKLLFGLGTETAPVRKLLGDTLEKGAGGFAKAVGTEAGEEAAAQIAGNVQTSALAPEGVQTPGVLEGAGEAAILGGIGGAGFSMVNALVPTIESGELPIPPELRSPEARNAPAVSVEVPGVGTVTTRNRGFTAEGLAGLTPEELQAAAAAGAVTITPAPKPADPVEQAVQEAAANVQANADVAPQTAAALNEVLNEPQTQTAAPEAAAEVVPETQQVEDETANTGIGGIPENPAMGEGPSGVNPSIVDPLDQSTPVQPEPVDQVQQQSPFSQHLRSQSYTSQWSDADFAAADAYANGDEQAISGLSKVKRNAVIRELLSFSPEARAKQDAAEAEERRRFAQRNRERPDDAAMLQQQMDEIGAIGTEDLPVEQVAEAVPTPAPKKPRAAARQSLEDFIKSQNPDVEAYIKSLGKLQELPDDVESASSSRGIPSYADIAYTAAIEANNLEAARQLVEDIAALTNSTDTEVIRRDASGRILSLSERFGGQQSSQDAEAAPAQMIPPDQAAQILNERLGLTNFDNIVFGNYAAKGGITLKGFVRRNSNKIHLNLPYIRNADELVDVFNEEATHLVYEDPAVAQQWARVKELVPQEQLDALRAEFEDRGYAPEVWDEESFNQIVRRAGLDELQKSAFRRFWEALKAAVGRLFGITDTTELNHVSGQILRYALQHQQDLNEETVGQVGRESVAAPFRASQTRNENTNQNPQRSEFIGAETGQRSLRSFADSYLRKFYGNPARHPAFESVLSLTDAPLQARPTEDGRVELGLGIQPIEGLMGVEMSEEAARQLVADAIDEEMLHVADLLAHQRIWRTSGGRESFTEYLRDRNDALLDSLIGAYNGASQEDRAAITAALGASMSAYNRTSFGSGFQDLVAALADDEQLAYNTPYELVRHLIQAHRNGEITETGWRRIVGKLKEWLDGALAALKSLYPVAREGKMGALLKDRIEQTEAMFAELEQSPEGDVELQSDSGAEGGIRAATPTGQPEPGKRFSQTGERTMVDERLTEEMRDIPPEQYPIKGQQATQNKARKIITAKGRNEALAFFKNPESAVEPEVRRAGLMQLVFQFDSLAALEKAKGNEAGSAAFDDLADLAVEARAELMDLANQDGRNLNIYNTYARMSPEGFLRRFERKLDKARTDALRGEFDNTDLEKLTNEVNRLRKLLAETRKGRTPTELDTATDEVDQAQDEESTTKAKKKQSQALKNKGVAQSVLDHLAKVMSDTPTASRKGTPSPLRQFINQHIQSPVDDFVERLQSEFQIGAELAQQLVDVIELNRSRSITADKALEEVRAQGKSDKIAEAALNRLATALSDTPSTAKPSLHPLQKLINDHIKNKVSDFVDQAEALGVKRAMAERLSEVIELNRDRAEVAAREKALQQAIEALKPKTRKARQRLSKLLDTVLRNAENGNIKRTELVTALSEALGIPVMPPELREEVSDMVAQINALPEGSLRQEAVVRLNDKLAMFQGIPAMDALLAMWYGNILAGLSTQAVNVYGNGMQAFLRTLAVLISNGNLTDSVNMLKGIGTGLKQGLAEAKSTWKDGMLHKTLKMDDLQKLGALEVLSKIPNKNFGHWLAYIGSIGGMTKYVFRAMLAADAVFWYSAYEGRANMAASRVVRNAGLKPGTPEFNAEFIKQLGQIQSAEERIEQAKKEMELAGLPATPERIMRRAFEIGVQNRSHSVQQESELWADRLVFQQKPEGVGKAVSNLLTTMQGVKVFGVPILVPLVPFNKIVSNLFESGLDWTGVGILRGMVGHHLTAGKDGRQFDEVERRERMAAGLMGMTAMGIAWMLNEMFGDEPDEDAKFRIWAYGPRDKAQREQWMAHGGRPFTMKVGDNYISYSENPLGMLFAALGGWSDANRYNKGLDKKSTTERAFYAFLQAMQSFSSQGVLSSVGTAVDVMTGGDPKGMKQVPVRTLSGAIPAQGLLRDMSTLFDENKIDDTNFYGALVKDIPVLKSTGRPSLNIFGEPVQVQGLPVVRRFMVGQELNENYAFLGRNGLKIPGLEQNIEIGQYLPDNMKKAAQRQALQLMAIENGVMTPDQRYEFVKRSGELTRKAVEKLRESTDGKIDPKRVEAYQKRLNDAVRDARKRAMLELVRTFK